jgi:antitoxin HicB
MRKDRRHGRRETRFAFPAKLTRDRESGGYTVSFRDLPEALTAGDDRAEALEQAADCLDEALAGRIADDEELPIPSAVRSGEIVISPPARIAGKAALHIAMREAGMSQRALARRIGCHQNEVRRLLDPKHATKIDRLAEVLERLDWRMTVTFEKVAA